MKVLFAVNNESISESIIKRYQQEKKRLEDEKEDLEKEHENLFMKL